MSDEPRGRGRPKLDPEEVKIPFPLRFSLRELRHFEAKARLKGMPLREWITYALRRSAGMPSTDKFH